MGARFRWYAFASTLATAAMVAYAYNTRQQFYPTVIYLVTSKLSISVCAPRHCRWCRGATCAQRVR